MKTFKEFDEYYSFIDKETKKNLTIKLTNNLVSVLSNIFSYNISKNEIKIVMNFCHKNLENIKRVWSNLNESDSIYEKELFINTIMNFINSKFELLVPDCKTFDGFNNFIHFFDRAITLDKIINKDSDNLTHLSEKLSNNLQNVIASDKKFIDIMCQIINKKMIEISVMNNNPENSASICNILQLLNYVNEKDVFYAKYSQYLIGRLLSSPNLYFEKQIVDTIESIQDYSYVKKLHKMIDDIGISESNLNNYKLIKINQKENTVDSNFSLDKLDFSSYEIKIDKQIESQITLDREIVIQANIINLLKIQKMNLDGIYHKLSDTLCKYFTVDKNIVKENLDILTKKEYITSNSDEYSNIVY
jgi:hypothetical protein